ncbi:MAG: glycine zipper domain-containing protein [Planctomycetota bacterium]|nr:glycine zipper domain-containing protein [Planctomycetota bacterium]
MLIRHSLALVALAITLLCGCQMNRAGKGAAIGGALGGIAGTVIGHQTGHDLAGAAIGAASGAVAGGLIGNAADARAERDDAVVTAAHFTAQHEAWNHAVPTTDVLQMVDSGLGDDVIINTIRERGSRFDASPENLVYMKGRGVSDSVIRALQTHTVPYPPSSVAMDVSGDFASDIR